MFEGLLFVLTLVILGCVCGIRVSICGCDDCNMCGVRAQTTIRVMRCSCRKAANLVGCMTLLSGMMYACIGRGQASQNLWSFGGGMPE